MWTESRFACQGKADIFSFRIYIPQGVWIQVFPFLAFVGKTFVLWWHSPIPWLWKTVEVFPVCFCQIVSRICAARNDAEFFVLLHLVTWWRKAMLAEGKEGLNFLSWCWSRFFWETLVLKCWGFFVLYGLLIFVPIAVMTVQWMNSVNVTNVFAVVSSHTRWQNCAFVTPSADGLCEKKQEQLLGQETGANSAVLCNIQLV